MFAKLKGCHLLIANIFKLHKFHKYQTFGLMKMHSMSKINYEKILVYDYRYTNADVRSVQYINLHVKNSTTQTAHYNIFHFLRYAHFRYAKCLFTNIQKQ